MNTGVAEYGFETPGGPGELYLFAHPLRKPWSKWVLALHGHGADPSIWLPTAGSFGDDTQFLVQAGFCVLAIDAGGPVTWDNDVALSKCDAAYTWATATKGLATKCSVMAWSMGGGLALNWIRRNPTKVNNAWLYAPATDLDALYANASYTAEMDAAYGGNYNANKAGHVPLADAALYSTLDIPIRIAHGTADTTVPLSASQAFVAAVNNPKITLQVVQGGGHNLGLSVASSDVLQALLAA